MGGNLNNNLMCCFCGKTILLKKAVFLIIQPNFKSKEKQEIFSHKICLISHLDKSVVLHPDIFSDNNNN